MQDGQKVLNSSPAGLAAPIPALKPDPDAGPQIVHKRSGGGGGSGEKDGSTGGEGNTGAGGKDSGNADAAGEDEAERELGKG